MFLAEDFNTLKLEVPSFFSSFGVQEGLLGTWVGSVWRLVEGGTTYSGKSLESFGQKGHSVFSS